MQRFKDGQDVVVDLRLVNPSFHLEVINAFIVSTHPHGGSVTLTADDLGITDGVWFLHVYNPAIAESEGVLYAFMGVYNGTR